MNLKPHGTIESKNATYPLPQQMAYTKVQRAVGVSQAKISNTTMKAIDYKMLATLLFMSYCDLNELSGKGLWHEIEGNKLLTIFAEHSGTKDITLLWESFTRIASFTVEYQRSEGDRRFKGVTSLVQIEEETFKNNKMFRFRFPDQLVPILLNPKLFAVLKINLILEMKSKYSIALYQMLVPYADLKYKDSIVMDIDDLKEWLKVPYSEKKSSAWKRFGTLKQSVLEPAISELNELSHTTGFIVSCEFYRRGRGGAVKEVRFNVEKIITTVEEKVAKVSQENLSDSPIKKDRTSYFFNISSLITHFEKIRNNIVVEPKNLTMEELTKAEFFLKGLDSLEQAKELISIICAFENRPDFFGGLFNHKARALGILKERQEREFNQFKEQQHAIVKHSKEQSNKESYRLECREYFKTVSEEELNLIEKQILRNSSPNITIYFTQKKETKAGKSMRNHVFFRWWLENIKKMDCDEIEKIL